jgi:hypothetical protein
MANTRKPLTVERKLLKMLLPAAQQPSTIDGPPPVPTEKYRELDLLEDRHA